MRFGNDVEGRAIAMPLSLCFAPSRRGGTEKKTIIAANAFPVTFFVRLSIPFATSIWAADGSAECACWGGFYNPETMLQAERKDGSQVKLLLLADRRRASGPPLPL